MDELEEVWGPNGRATTAPSTIRPVSPTPAPPGPPVAAPPPVAPEPWSPAPQRAREVVAGRPPTPTRPGGALVLAGVAVAVVALVMVLVSARMGGGPPPTPPVAASMPATTIVSAAADLLGRATTTTTTLPPPTSTTAEASPPASTPRGPMPPAPDARTRPPVTGLALADAERVAQRFVDVVAVRDCDGLWSLLGRESQRSLTARADPDAPDGRSLLCEALGSGRELPAMVVRGPAIARPDGAAAVPLESQGEVEDLVLVAEDGRWVIDLFGAMPQGS